MRKIGITLLWLSSLLFASSTFSTTNHIFSQSLTVEYELPPNDPQVFSNFFFWKINAICTVISEAPENPMSIKVLRKAGSVNGLPLEAGDAILLVVHPGDLLTISADSGSKVELINLGSVSIKTICSSS